MKSTTAPLAFLLLLLLGTTFTPAKSATVQEDLETPDVVGEILDLDRSNITLAYKGDWILVVYAEWCPHCHRLMSVLPDVARELDGKVKVARLEGSDTFWVQLQFLLEAYPTIFHFHDGEARLYDGDRDAEDMVEYALEEWRKTPAIPYWKSPTSLHMRVMASYAEFVRAVYGKIEVVADRMDVDPLVLTIVLSSVCILILGFTLFRSARGKRREVEKKIKQQKEKKEKEAVKGETGANEDIKIMKEKQPKQKSKGKKKLD